MKEKIKKILIKYWKIISIFLIVLVLFYWLQIRPSQTYSYCHESAQKKAIEVCSYCGNNKFEVATYESYYKQCLRSKGFNK